MKRLTRREFLIQGGLGVSLAALVAACGDTTGPSGPGRIGNGDEGEELPGVTVDDAVLARTAQSLHHSAAAMHQAILDSGHASASVAAVLPVVIQAHVDQADRMGSLTGGNSFDCPNPFATERFVDPTIEALTEGESSNKQADANKAAIAFEEWVARSHQDMVSHAGPELRAALIRIGTEVTRHSVVLSLSAGEPAISPTLEGDDPVDSDEAGYPIYYAVPTRFGLVSAVPLTVGDPNEEGQRYSLNLPTPADNTFVGAEMTCSGG